MMANSTYYERNRDELLEKQKEYYRGNREERLTYQRDYYNKNRKAILDQQKNAKRSSYQQEYYRKNVAILFLVRLSTGLHLYLVLSRDYTVKVCRYLNLL